MAKSTENWLFTLTLAGGGGLVTEACESVYILYICTEKFSLFLDFWLLFECLGFLTHRVQVSKAFVSFRVKFGL